MREQHASNRRTELRDRGRKRFPLRPHHQRVDDREAVVVGDDAGVAHARFATGLEPDPNSVGNLVERDRRCLGHAATLPLHGNRKLGGQTRRHRAGDGRDFHRPAVAEHHVGAQ